MKGMNVMGKGRVAVWIVVACSLCGVVGSGPGAFGASAAKKQMDEQYMAVGRARTRAELAMRKARAVFGPIDKKWRGVSLKADQAHTEIINALRKAEDDERHRSEELRNQALIDELNQRQRTVEQDWQRYSGVDRAAMESDYRDANTAAQAIGTLFGSITQLEPAWKDTKVDLPTLEAMYEAVANRANAIREQAEGAFADLEKGTAMWQKAAAAATQPTTRPQG
jgi:hypothetical protein